MVRKVKSKEALLELLGPSDCGAYWGRNGLSFVNSMFDFCGREIEVVPAKEDDYDYLHTSGNIANFLWLEEWLEPIEEEKAPSFAYDPKKDIDTYELARILPIIMKIDTPEFNTLVEVLEEPFNRHFTEL